MKPDRRVGEGGEGRVVLCSLPCWPLILFQNHLTQPLRIVSFQGVKDSLGGVAGWTSGRLLLPQWPAKPVTPSYNGDPGIRPLCLCSLAFKALPQDEISFGTASKK